MEQDQHEELLRRCWTMTDRTDVEFGLTRLSDSEFILEDRTQDIRGLDVYDTNGEEIGIVEGLYVDEEERKVRFLDVGAGGFLGLGEKHFLVPVEIVVEVNETGVVVYESRQKVVDSPLFDTSVVPQAPYQRDIYDYYGYARSGGRMGLGAWPGGI
jgi:sporulation protein YlmC with PRC-barrel domain